jgi:hypothetical protein
MLMQPGVPADLLSQIISTVAEVIRGNAANQQLFSTVVMQSSPPRPIIIILLMSMINEKQPFHLRCSILYCFQSYLFRNEDKKAEVIETLLPKDQSGAQSVSGQINAGQILCSGLFHQNDLVSNWLCAIALSHTINDTNKLKEKLLCVQLAVSAASGAQAVSLMQQCMSVLSEAAANSAGVNGIRFQTKVSYLMLLATWLSNCPSAVDQFLAHQQNVPYVSFFCCFYDGRFV